VERRDVGAGTGALLFLRSMGAAFGSTLVGAMLTIRFNHGLAAQGVTQRIDLGALRGSGGLQQLDAATRAVARLALANGFHWAFASCAAMCLVAVIACSVMRDLPLQSAAR
jgi:hypothetical protein